MMETTTKIEEKEKKMMEIGGEEEKKTEQIVAKLLAQASIEDGQGEQCCAAGSSGTSAAIEEAEEELATNSHSGELDADKQKCQFQIWLNENGNCLYPTREQKQRLAEKMGIDFVKVNKLFANHRRRQQKQQKIVQLQKMEQIGETNKENRRHHLPEEAEEMDKIDQTIEEIRSKVTGRKQPRLSLMAGDHHQQCAGGNNGEIAVPIASSQLSPPPSVHPSPPHHGLQSAFPAPNFLPQGLDLLQLLAAANRHPPPPLPPQTFQPHQQQIFSQQSAIFGGKNRQPMAMDPHRPNPQQQTAPPQLAANPHANLMLAALAHVHQQQQLAAQQQQQQQQFAMVKAAIEKEIFELLNAAQNHQNVATLAQRHQLLGQIQRGEHQQPTNQQQQIGQMHAPMVNNNIMIPQNIQQPIGVNVGLPAHHLPIPHSFLSPANSAIGSCGSPSSSACSTDSILAHEEEANSFDLDLVEKQIAAQNNRLSAAEAEAAAVLLGLSTAGGVGR